MASPATDPTAYFLFKGLKTYASPEWIAEDKKKYRRVFESLETTYIYAELSLQNNRFCQEKWTANVNLKCFRLEPEAKELLCDISVQQTFLPNEHTIYIREGWGHKEAGFYWKRGDYLWEAYLENHFLGARTFYIEDSGPVVPGYNPYFDITSIKLFEGPNEGTETFDRTYLKQFNAREARYVWVELALENMISHAWFCELTFYFKNSNGELKGQTVEIKQVQPEDDELIVATGLGSNTAGTWYYGRYSIEIIFMDRLIAVIPFDCGDYPIEGLAHAVTSLEDGYFRTEDEGYEEDLESMESVLSRINELTGLADIKKKIFDYVEYLEFLKLRKEKGFDEGQPISLHSVFIGNPGTGKTTIAKLMGKVYHKLGFLTKGSTLEVGRAELIGQYIGQTAPKVKEVIEAARGGVLFIDEAYSLVRNDDDKDYGHEVIEVLVKEMSDGPGNIAIFVAGYPKGMQTFLNSNPGFKSRFRAFFSFPDYTPQELNEILQLALQKKEVSATKQARILLAKKLEEYYRERREDFGNARLVYNLIEEAKMEMGLRVMRQQKSKALTEKMLTTIKLIDIEQIFKKRELLKPAIGIDLQLLKESLAQIDSLIGLEAVKREINELVALVKFYIDTGRNVLNEFSLHLAFKGNPGTGKTTVARILANIFRALGVLERGHLVECSREMLVAGYIGQTALKTKELIDRAKGGLLFIDEAYALNGGPNDFGKEAIEVLLKEMEDNRGSFSVVVAGYTQPMDKFLEGNPGLKSRFDTELIFEDLSQNELLAVIKNMLHKEKLVFTEDAEDGFGQFLALAYKRRDKYFGNAREARKWVEKIIKNQHLRLAKLPAHKRTRKAMQTVASADVAEFNATNTSYFGKPGIGFQAQ